MRRGVPLALFVLGALALVVLAALLAGATAVSLSRDVLPSRAGKQMVEVAWSGTPYPVQPLPIECLGNGILVYGSPGAASRFFALADLRQEAAIVRDLLGQGTNRLGFLLGRAGQGTFLGAALEADPRLRDSFVLAMRRVDASNRSSRDGGGPLRQPILLVRPSGIGCFEPVTYLLDTATRLQIGSEPMLQAWLYAGASLR